MTLTGYPSVDTDITPQLRAIVVPLVRFLRIQRKPVMSPVIEAEFSISGVQVRALVSWMRKQGDPTLSRIASDENGYSWARDWDEMETTRSHLLQRARSIHVVLAGIYRAFDHNPDQGEMPL